jgi:hypothetical protein
MYDKDKQCQVWKLLTATYLRKEHGQNMESYPVYLKIHTKNLY